MARERSFRRGWYIASVGAVVEAAIWTFATTHGSPFAVAAALVIQVGTMLALVWELPRRRWLAAALSLAIPIVGPITATLAATVSGRGSRDLLHDPLAETGPSEGAHGGQLVRALSRALPSCDAVLSDVRDIRRPVLARLARRGSASDLAVLRWARTQVHGELAVEVALTLEDAVTRFEGRVSAARAHAAALPADYDANAQAFAILVEGVCNGVVGAATSLEFAREARSYYDAALAADRERGHRLIADRARLELAVNRPEAALETLAGVDLATAGTELVFLFEQAAYAARRFDLTTDLVRRTRREASRL